MGVSSKIGRITGLAGVCGLALLLAACQSGDSAAVLDPGAQPAPETIDAAELRAYCPPVRLREGTAYYNTYAPNAQGDASRIVYQASITDVTRSCTYEDGTVRMNVAVAGRIVPGPAGATGTIRMPIRVVVLRGSEVVYSQLHDHPVQVADTAGATQFLFNDTGVVLSAPDQRNLLVFAGYDEGPR